MTATTERCPGCHGSGIEMSGVTYAGMSEYVGCHECGPECPDDCGCRASDATERPESIAPRHPGATQSPDGSQGAPEGPRGAEGATGHGISAVPHLETAPLPSASDVRPVPPAQDAVSDAEAAEWARLVAEATEGPWVVDQDGSIGAPMAGLVCGEDGHPRPDCSECGTRVCHVNVMPSEPDAVFIASARTAVPLLLAEREALRAEVAALWAEVERLHGQAKVEDVFYLDMCQERDHERAMCAERTAERDRARSLAARLEAENARLREGIESMMRDVGKAQPAHVTPGIVAVRLKALLAEDEGGE